jgi:hypothetical protein
MKREKEKIKALIVGKGSKSSDIESPKSGVTSELRKSKTKKLGFGL